MKKLLRAWLAVLLAACLLAGCSLGGDAPSSQPSDSSEGGSRPEAAPIQLAYKIGVVQFQEQGSSNTLREAFLARLEEWGCGEEVIEIDYQNAGGNSSRAEEICRKFVADKKDMIVAVSAPAAKAALAAARDSATKVVFSGVSDPEQELELYTSDQVGRNVTGVCAKVPVSSILELAVRADPALTTVGLLYDPSDDRSVKRSEEARSSCEALGLKVEDCPVEDGGTLPAKMTELCGKAGAVFSAVGEGSLSAAAEAAKAAVTANRPWYTGDVSLVQQGALASIDADYAELGRKTADMAVRLMLGRAVSEVPVVNSTETVTTVNQATLSSIGLVFPTDVLGTADLLF